MKKILLFLSTISSFTIISTNIITCKQTNENNKHIKSIEPKFISQQPPINSNWKLDNNPNFINYKVDNKWYIVIFQNNTKDWYIINFLNNSTNDKILSTFSFDGVRQNVYLSDLINYFKNGNVKTVYYSNNNNKPTTPTINKNTGKITDWNEKIES